MNTSPTQFLWGAYGSFSSPNYPGSYPINVEKNYILTMPTQMHKYRIHLTFSALDIEKEMNCNWDYLGWGPAIGSIDKQICGTTPKVYTINNVQKREVFKFYSDYMVVRGGFHVNYNVSKEPDACDSSPCKHNATCTPHGYGYNCTCSFGFYGKNCEYVNLCDYTPCLHNGMCNRVGNSFNCSCPYPYTGKTCNETINPCDDNPCDNGASCIPTNGSYYCNCSHGWTGQYCEDDINECVSFPCHNNATCFNWHGGFTCYCQKGYYGNACEFDSSPCNQHPCMNGGLCSVDRSTYMFVCMCPHGYTGKYCELGMHSTTMSYTSYNPYYVLSKLMLARNRTEATKVGMQRVLGYLNLLKKKV
ncbi:fibropellin-1-like [Gigantopelta aegis]|uniref:fibropellin-1-like n=1 Tax=Gigantopelta aegis TaxID=1735272 RepID=UPI001B88AFAD|nr:fibropellin-1-like [Gigantopelta aegis]